MKTCKLLNNAMRCAIRSFTSANVFQPVSTGAPLLLHHSLAHVCFRSENVGHAVHGVRAATSRRRERVRASTDDNQRDHQRIRRSTARSHPRTPSIVLERLRRSAEDHPRLLIESRSRRRHAMHDQPVPESDQQASCRQSDDQRRLDAARGHEPSGVQARLSGQRGDRLRSALEDDEDLHGRGAVLVGLAAHVVENDAGHLRRRGEGTQRAGSQTIADEPTESARLDRARNVRCLLVFQRNKFCLRSAPILFFYLVWCCYLSHVCSAFSPSLSLSHPFSIVTTSRQDLDREKTRLRQTRSLLSQFIRK